MQTTRLRIKHLILVSWGLFAARSVAAQRTDTAAIIRLLEKGNAVYREKPDSGIYFAQQAVYKTQRLLPNAKGKLKRRLLTFKKDGIGTLATVYHERGDMDRVIPYYNQMFAIQKKLGDKKGMASTLYGIAGVHSGQGNIPQAIEYHSRALKIYENLKDKYGIALEFFSLGRIYGDLEDTLKQEEYYNKAYTLFTEINDTWGISLMKTSLGGIYLRRGEYDKAMRFYRDCLVNYSVGRKPDGTGGDQWGIANSLEAIGRVHDKKNVPDSALFYYEQALEIRERTEYLIGIALSHTEIGEVYLKQNKVNKARAHAQKALEASQQLGFPRNISRAAKLLSAVKRQEGNYKEALEMFELYTHMMDSLQNDENRKISFRQQLSYEFEKKENLLKAREERKLAVAREESARKNVILWSGAGGLLLVLLFSVFLFNRFRVTNRQKKIIEIQQRETEKQKEIIEEKNKDITDSINYARNIQSAILPSPETITHFFPQSFVLFKPRDIVSGDFYFLEQVKDHIILAVADCTGHGVPGALVSVVCSNALTRAVKEFELTVPGEILDKTRELVLETFGKENKQVKDGMDISLVSLAYRTQNESGERNGTAHSLSSVALRWAGANNPLWIVKSEERKVKSETNSESNLSLVTCHSSLIHELHPDKQPIGFSDQPKPFTTHTVTLQKGDICYLFTDGFADQFGGEKGKKMKSSRFKEIIASLKTYSIKEQKQKFDRTFEDWKGNLEQIDDVCVMAVRI